MARSDEFERSEARTKALRKRYPVAVGARYDTRDGKVVVSLASGIDISFAPRDAQGLEDASAADLKTIQISPSGYGLHFPKIDADLYLPSLIDGFLGSRKWSAARLGREGGRAKSAAKSEASRRNGKLGGRPRKVTA